MRHARFGKGNQVIHCAYDVIGTVRAAFFDGEQHRYYVEHSDRLWSVPEENLLFYALRNQPLTNVENAQIGYRPRSGKP